PEDAVEEVFGAAVGLGEREPSRGVGVFAQQRMGKLLWLRVQAVGRDVAGGGGEGLEISSIGEAIEHGGGGGVELVHGWKAQNQLDGAKEAGLVVLAGDDAAVARVRADDIGGGAVAADVVPAGLRVVFDGENAGLRPEPAAAEGFNDLAHGEVVVGDMGIGRRGTGSGAA